MQYKARIMHLKTANRKLRAAEEAHKKTIQFIFPVGEVVEYIIHGKTPKKGIIVEHGYNDHIFVRDANNRRQKITPYHILSAHEIRKEQEEQED